MLYLLNQEHNEFFNISFKKENNAVTELALLRYNNNQIAKKIK